VESKNFEAAVAHIEKGLGYTYECKHIAAMRADGVSHKLWMIGTGSTAALACDACAAKADSITEWRSEYHLLTRKDAALFASRYPEMEALSETGRQLIRSVRN